MLTHRSTNCYGYVGRVAGIQLKFQPISRTLWGDISALLDLYEVRYVHMTLSHDTFILFEQECEF